MDGQAFFLKENELLTICEKFEGASFSFDCWLQIVELPSHQFFVGVQFHPEFKSRPWRPSAPFLGTTKFAVGC